MKLDLGKAWTDATAMLGANREVVLVVAGLFFFLPYFAIGLLFPESINPETVEPPPGADPDVVMEMSLAAMQAQYARVWPALLVGLLIQMVGSLALLALLTDREKPTVGEALKVGAFGFPTYLGVQILTGLISAVSVLLVGGLAGFMPTIVAVLLTIVMIAIVLYLLIKFCLATAIIAIEREMNPIAAIARSWKLTKGNSFRLAAFFILLIIAIGVISILVSSVFGLVFAALGGAIENIGLAFVSGGTNAVVSVIILGVLAAIHRQLAGPSTETLSKTFD
ncbi:MAG: glycerophosphoryl diester phosphodiesterase membrane domain-containing protein [Erythrobacter sp.]